MRETARTQRWIYYARATTLHRRDRTVRALTTALLVVVLANGCSNTDSDRVAELQLEMNTEEPTTTPTTEPTPTAQPEPSVEPTSTTKPLPGDCTDLANSYVPVENPGVPPFSGTLEISPHIMSASDPTSLGEQVAGEPKLTLIGLTYSAPSEWGHISRSE